MPGGERPRQPFRAGSFDVVYAGVAKLADARDLRCGDSQRVVPDRDSRPRHQPSRVSRWMRSARCALCQRMRAEDVRAEAESKGSPGRHTRARGGDVGQLSRACRSACGDSSARPRKSPVTPARTTSAASRPPSPVSRSATGGGRLAPRPSTLRQAQGRPEQRRGAASLVVSLSNHGLRVEAERAQPAVTFA
jgi:hypothetical protein